MNRRVDVSGHMRRWWPAWLIVGAALAIRLVHIYLTVRHNPLASDLRLDASIYDIWARTIIAGGEPVASNLMQAPLYPWFMAAIYKTFTASADIVRLFQALMGAASCAFVIVITYSLFRSKAASLVAGVMSALYLPLIFYEGILVPATLIVFLNMLSLTILVSKGGLPSSCRTVFSGLFLGASIAAKPVSALLIPFIFIHLYYSARGAERATARADRRRILYGILIFSMGIILAVAPVTIRNAMITGEFIPVSSGLGINFYHGANPSANGYYAVPTYKEMYIGATPEDQARSIAMIASKEEGRELTHSEVSRFWLKKGIEYNIEHPGRFWRLLATKALYFLNKHERANVENFNFHRGLPGVLGLPLLTFGIIAPLGIMGIFATRADWRSLWILYGGVITYFAACVIFYVLARYRLPVVTFLIPFAGAGVVQLYVMLRRRVYIDLALVVAATALLFYLINLEVVTDTVTGKSSFLTRVGSAYMVRGERDKAAEVFLEAVELNRDNARAKKALESMGKLRRESGTKLEDKRLDRK